MNIALRVLVLYCLLIGSVSAQSMELSIPQQNLADALHSLSSQTGIQLLFNAAQIRGVSQAVEGSLKPEEALNRLLKGTPYSYENSSANTYVIKTAAPDKLVLPEVKVTGAMDSDAPGNPSYTRTHASTATKSNLPIMQTPMAVQVVPRAVMRDQQAVQIEEVTKNVSGVFPGFTFGGFAEEFMIRGFNTDFLSYRDGFRFPAARLPLANIERVEVVKGAAANLYGRIEPGGMINLITKRPQAQRYYSLNQQFGSYGQYQMLADATGALNTSGTLLYRVNFEYLNKNSFRDFGFHERTFVAPSLSWKITPNTQLDVDFMFSDENTREDYGTVALGNRPAQIPRSRFLGEPADKSKIMLYNSAATLTHAFNADWQVRARFNHLHKNVANDAQTSGASLNELTGELQRNFFGGGASINNTYLGTVDLTGKFNTKGIEHNVLAGWDYYGGFFKSDATNSAAGSINIFRPQYNNVNLSLQPSNFFVDRKDEWNGVYVQDQITLFGKLHLMGGMRYDWASTDVGIAIGEDKTSSDAKAAVNKVNNARFSPRAGIVYQPWEWLSFYGNYVQSLGSANSAFDAARNVLKPQIGEQFEGGFKTSFFNGRLNSNVAYYYLTKQNLAIRVPGQPYSLPIGEARSQGVEVDISGEITSGLNIILTYAYTDAKVLTGNNEGNQLFNVPKHAGSVWARYDMQTEWLRGLSVGAGIYAQSRRPGDTANSYFLPSQARVDAMIRYRLPVAKSRFSVQLNAYNLADETLYGGTLGDRFSINMGMPRTFIGSIHYAM